VEAIGFKAVHGGPISGAVRVDDQVLATMEQMAPLAPAHNPPYIAAMRSFREKLPRVVQVAAFETAFHSSIPLHRQAYAVPYEWITQHGIRRYGFHGASNAYLTARLADIAPNCRKLINLHLGGSCSICAVRDGKSVAHSMGTSAQTGVFHATRVGDFDPFAILALRAAGLEVDEIYRRLGQDSGLLGLSGVSADLREVESAAAAGNERAQLAVDAFVESCRHYLCAYLGVLNGADAIVFTGGIGQHGTTIREAILRDLDYAAIALDPQLNRQAGGQDESRIDAAESQTQIWVVPTNEELIVARQTVEVLNQQPA
jgi:acetate kinase